MLSIVGGNCTGLLKYYSLCSRTVDSVRLFCIHSFLKYWHTVHRIHFHTEVQPLTFKNQWRTDTIWWSMIISKRLFPSFNFDSKANKTMEHLKVLLLLFLFLYLTSVSVLQASAKHWRLSRLPLQYRHRNSRLKPHKKSSAYSLSIRTKGLRILMNTNDLICIGQRFSSSFKWYLFALPNFAQLRVIDLRKSAYFESKSWTAHEILKLENCFQRQSCVFCLKKQLCRTN